MQQATEKLFTKYARHFFSGTLLSRISGMGRDIAMAVIFGDHPSVGAFMVAFRFSQLLRRLLAEGMLQGVFTPQYEELRLKDEKKAADFFVKLSLFLSIFLLLIIFIVCSFTGYAIKSGSTSELLPLFQTLFPSLLFISLYGLNIALLQSHGHYFSSSFAPFLCNCCWILATIIYAKKSPAIAMHYLAFATLVGFVLQWLVTLPHSFPTLKLGWKKASLSLTDFSQELKKIGKATTYGLIGIAAIQVNNLFDMVFARYSEVKGPIFLWYGIRLQQLPLAVIGFACVYSITPTLIRLIKAKNEEEFHNHFIFGLKRIFFLLIPTTFGLIALSRSVVSLLFGYGHFSHHAVIKTAYTLCSYSFGLIPITLTLYYASIFYAHNEYKLPMLFSLISVGCNLLLNSFFVFICHLDSISVAIATSISAFINYFILKQCYKRKFEIEKKEAENIFSVKISLASLIAMVITLYTEKQIEVLLNNSLVGKIILFLTLSSIFLIFFFSFLYLFSKREFLNLKTYLFK